MFSELVLKRQSTREYTGAPVDKETVLKILDTAKLAPTACNAQPWVMHAVVTPETVSEIAKAVNVLGANGFAKNAGAFVVIEEKPAGILDGPVKMTASKKFSPYDTGILTAHIVLAAEDIGVKSCILGMFDKDEIIKTLGLDKNAKIALVVALGYSEENYPIRNKNRKPAEKVIKVY